MKVIIVGGVAGGASCAARLRRLDESAEILMVERGPHVSYANCGLPYHIGGVIEKESSLLVASAETFRSQFAIDVRTGCEAIRVSAGDKTVDLRDVSTGAMTTESYDKLVLAPGAPSVRPALPGIDLPGIFQVRTVPDARMIREWIEGGFAFPRRVHGFSGSPPVRPSAVVVGAGFVGLETAENLVHRNFDVTLLDRSDQVLAPLDPGMARLVERHLEAHSVHVALGEPVVAFQRTDSDALVVLTRSGKSYPADIVVLALGVRPDTTLAKSAGLAIGELGGIRVDAQMRTSDPDIFAVGDAVEVEDFVTGDRSLVTLAGPANRQGRIAADVIAGRNARFRGAQGTSIVGLFGATAAWTGASEKTLERTRHGDFEKVYLYPNSHAAYYPGAKPIAMKVIFRKADGRLLGAQAFGEDGVHKRISTLAMAIQMRATVWDLEEAELCYAPQFGSAKDPLNFAGMIAANALRGDMPVAHWGDFGDAFLLDVRNAAEVAADSVRGAINIPLGELRARLSELPCERDILVICRSGTRSYYATRILLQNGFEAKNVVGGMLLRSQLQAAEHLPPASSRHRRARPGSHAFHLPSTRSRREARHALFHEAN